MCTNSRVIRNSFETGHSLSPAVCCDVIASNSHLIAYSHNKKIQKRIKTGRLAILQFGAPTTSFLDIVKLEAVVRKDSQTHTQDHKQFCKFYRRILRP